MIRAVAHLRAICNLIYNLPQDVGRAVREKKSLERHFILVFCAYTFILWHKLTGGLRRRWANKPLNTFPEALEAFRTAISYRFVQ